MWINKYPAKEEYHIKKEKDKIIGFSYWWNTFLRNPANSNRYKTEKEDVKMEQHI